MLEAIYSKTTVFEYEHKYFHLCQEIHKIYEYVIRNKPKENEAKIMANDPNTELGVILDYAKASNSYITAQNTLIAQLEATISAGGGTVADSDSADVEANIQAILAFQAANPIPTAPVAAQTPPATSAS